MAFDQHGQRGRESVEAVLHRCQERAQFSTLRQSWSDIIGPFKIGEIVIGMGYPGSTLELRLEGYPFEYTLAEEGEFLWTCGYGITSSSQSLDVAYALLNFYLSPQAEAFEAKQWNYMVTNEVTLKVASDQVSKKARLDQAYDLGNALPAAPPAQGHPDWVRAGEDLKRC